MQSAGETVRVSTSSSGGEANAGSSINSVSADGRFITFSSNASNLIPGVSGAQVYIKDTITGALTLASSSQNGAQSDGSSSEAMISLNGRFVVFQSSSSNLIPSKSNGLRNIYLKDLQTGNIELISQNSNGVVGDQNSFTPNISSDGRYISFYTNSSNLIDGVTGQQVYLKDTHTGELSLVSSNSTGTQGNDASEFSTLSSDGRFIAFQSVSTNLIPGVSGSQIYLKDLQTGNITLASSSESGLQGNNTSSNARLSADGRFIAFQSSSTNLVSGSIGPQVYIKDTISNEVKLVSSNINGEYGLAVSFMEDISADGRFVVFRSTAANLITGVSGEQLYRKDLKTGAIELISRSLDGTIGNAQGARITADGSKVFFSSTSSLLIEGDTNGASDVFLRDLSKTGINELAGMVVSNQASARTTLTLTKQRLETLNLARAGIGASVSRIETSISNLSSMTQNIASASSQITDTDVAEESARLVANQILQQAGAAVLAQANAQPQIVLRLLSDV